jgi:hypothetical protein
MLVILLKIAGSAANSFVFYTIGKIWDFLIGDHRIARLKEQYKLEHYWLAFAGQSWRRLYQRAAVLADQTLARLFGRRVLSFSAVIRFLGFSIVLNSALAFTPILISASHFAYSGRAVKLWIGITGAFVVINSLLDFCAYSLTRYLLRRPPRSSTGIIVSFGLIVLVGWLVATASLVVGGAMTTMPMLATPLSVDTLLTVTVPLMRGWYLGQLLHPFTANVSIQGINLGYLALGALPSLLVLLSVLLIMLVLRFTAEHFRHGLAWYFARVLSKKDVLFTHLGLMISVVLALLYWTVTGICNWLG